MKSIIQNLSSWSLWVALGFLVGCQNLRPLPGAESAASGVRAESGDLIVSNGGSRSILLLDSDGLFKRVLYSAGVGEAVWGITWLAETREVVIGIDGVDRIIAVNADTGLKRDFVIDIQFTGTLRDITRLASGDVLAIETNAVERFTSDGVRVVAGGWPKTTLQTAPQGIGALDSGGFVMCSTTSDVVRTYTSEGVQVATASSGIAGTTDGTGCAELSNGNIAVAWSGTTDTVQIRNPTLGSVLASFSDLAVLNTPSGLVEAANGNILIADSALHHLVEISPNGTFVRLIGLGVLNIPRSISVVP